MKKTIYLLILPLVVVSGVLFANLNLKNDTKPASKTLTSNERNKWEASPDGLKYNKWKASPEGTKVHASHDKIKKYIKAFDNMPAVVIANSKSSGPRWLIVRINGEEYMMQFSLKEFEQLSNLKVNDKIIVRSHSAGYSPNHPYLIVSGDYIERNGKLLFKREFSKNNRC